MRFVVDNQLSPRLSKFLEEAGHDSVHVATIGMDTADDRALWSWAGREDRVRACATRRCERGGPSTLAGVGAWRTG